MNPTRVRLVGAAFELFKEVGYENVKVEDIAARAGLGRTTFFRHFPSKEDVVFPDHAELLARVETRLSTATAATGESALRESCRIVLDHYVAEGEVARTRYRLTRSVPALRDREVASVQDYIRLFARRAREWNAGETDGELRSELLAAGVVTAHNHVLRGWLRGEVTDVSSAFEAAMSRTFGYFDDAADRGSTVVIVPRLDRDVDSVLREVRAALDRSW